MATYADWAASRQSAPGGQSSSAPVKLVIDGQGNVLHDAQSAAMSVSAGLQSHGSMIEETPMSVDDQQEVVQSIRARQRSNDSGDYLIRQTYHPTTINDEQRAWSSRSIPSTTILLVIDTNWLLSHLKLFAQIEQLVTWHDSAYAPVVFILPTVVLKELDGLKNSEMQAATDPSAASRHTPSIAHLARTASTFVLDKLTHRPDLFRGQKTDEGSIQGAVQALKSNDEQVLDCCSFFQKQGYQVGLLSDDKILCSQATVAGVPYMNFVPEDNDPEAFLAKLHPDLPPYLHKLKAATTSNGSSHNVSSASSSTTDFTLQAFASKATQMQEDLLAQQISAIAHLEHNFPLMPSELLEVISVVTNSLLSPVIFPILLHHMASDNLEIFAYMLRRSSIFRDFPSRNGSSDEEVLDCTRWNAAICLRLMDQNWQVGFADKVGKIVIPVSTVGNGNTAADFSPSNIASTPSSMQKSSPGSSLSSSRWASASSSSFSPRRNFSPSSSQASLSSSATFHPSKLSALAKAFVSPQEDILRWSSARWRLVLEDLEMLLCRTAILNDVPDGKQKADLLLKAARKNVDSWKAT